MRLHRFYIDPEHVKLEHHFWLHDERLLNQWCRVLRYKVDDELVLFDGVAEDRLYRLKRIEKDGVELELVTEFARKVPEKEIYLFCSLLKKDKNEWVIQKGTELGVHSFVPILAARSEKTGFDMDRANKITIEAAEQCGRSDIPNVREPLSLEAAIAEFKDKLTLVVCDESLEANTKVAEYKRLGVFVGPEGGWSQEELGLFESEGLGHLHLGNFTLRAETAAVTAIAKLVPNV